MRTLLNALVVVLALMAPIAAHAQVGFDPTSSPYRDARVKQTFTFMGGRVSGGRGDGMVGPGSGNLIGARWDIHVGAGTALHLGASGASLGRARVRPRDPPATRFFGEADQTIFMFDAGANLLLTGRKSWRGLAPYIGGSFGIALGQNVQADSSNFRFSTHFHFGPSIGTRIFLNRRVHIRIEARDIIWRLSYPDTFFGDEANPNLVPILDPRDHGRTEWVHNLTLTLGIGYSLRI